MAHHDRSIRKHFTSLAEEGGLSVSTAGELYGAPKSTARTWLQKYQTDEQVGRRRRTGLWRISSPAQDAALIAETQRNLFTSASCYWLSWSINEALISRLKEAGF